MTTGPATASLDVVESKLRRSRAVAAYSLRDARERWEDNPTEATAAELHAARGWVEALDEALSIIEGTREEVS